MDTPQVTVLMNCYNGAKFLAEAVDSVLAQTMPHWELLFWDNRSTDDSAARIQQYNDDRIRYFLASDHTSLGKARRLAVRHARGQWLGILDIDDLWLPEKLERQLARASAKPDAGLIYGRCEVFAHEGIVARTGISPALDQPLLEGQVFEQLALDNFMSLVSILYRRDLMDAVGGFRDFQQAADYDLSLRLACRYPVAAVDAVVCRYRCHENNTTHRMFELGSEELEEIFADLKEEPGATEGLRRWRANQALGWLMQGRLGRGCAALWGGDKLEFTRLVWRGVSRRLYGR